MILNSEHAGFFLCEITRTYLKSIYQNNSVMPAKAGIQNYLK
jgi:hypothetical protein